MDQVDEESRCEVMVGSVGLLRVFSWAELVLSLSLALSMICRKQPCSHASCASPSHSQISVVLLKR